MNIDSASSRNNPTQLRDQALHKLADISEKHTSKQPPEKLYYELQVHQIELEMQNEELQRINAALEESRDRYLELVEFSPVGHLTLTQTSLISEANLNGAALFGVPRGQLIQRGFADFVASHDRELWERHFLSVVQYGGKQNVEITLQRRDGSLFPARVTCIRLEKDQQDPGVRIAIEDITDVDELRRAVAETKIAAIVFESRQGMLITDAESVILRVNRAFTDMCGYEESEAIGQSLNMIESNVHNEEFYDAMWEHVRRTGSWQGEVWGRCKSGTIFPALITLSAVTGDNQDVRHYVCTMLDITRRKEVEEQIENLAFYDPLTRIPNRFLLSIACDKYWLPATAAAAEQR